MFISKMIFSIFSIHWFTLGLGSYPYPVKSFAMASVSGCKPSSCAASMKLTQIR